MGTSIAVTTTDDEINTDGDCSLREAVISANTESITNACPAGSGSDGISVPAGSYTFTIAGEGENAAVTGDLDLTDVDGVAIKGAGADNTIIDAGGIDRVFEVSAGTASISGVTVKGGRLFNSNGGGILNSGGTLTLNDSTVNGNRADFGNGGGIYSDTELTGAIRTTVTNSTISGNLTGSSEGRSGGGIFNRSGLTTIEHSTITNNTAPDGFGSGVASSGDADTPTELLSTIVSANINTDADFVGGTTNSFSSKGYNLIGDGNSTAAFNKPGDRANVADSRLGPLANNGGATPTHALLAGSPAIDAGPSSCPATDQRSQTRPKDGDGNGVATCDIGAFEKEATPPPPPPPNTKPTVTTLSLKSGARTFDTTPLIRAKVRDTQTNLAKGNVKLFVDGRRKAAFFYRPSTDVLRLTSGKLKVRGHTVKIVATDGGGLSVTKVWRFGVVERRR